MSAQPTDGGPAFPQPENMDGTYADPTTCKQFMPYRGMSLRDWFAGKALGVLHGGVADVFTQSLLANIGSRDVETVEYRAKRIGSLAVSAYEIADAMLLAREAKR